MASRWTRNRLAALAAGAVLVSVLLAAAATRPTHGPRATPAFVTWVRSTRTNAG
jgi:hypothetical protein